MSMDAHLGGESSKAEPAPRVWSPAALGAISAGGDLARRAEQNWRRLQHPAYRVPQVFTNMTADSWPGDWVSRVLINSVLLARSTGKEPTELAKIVRAIPAQLNSDGYFGELIDPSRPREQQLGSPHGWLMRGLCEYHCWTSDELALDLLDTVIRNVAHPVGELWETYPLTSESRPVGAGAVAGGEWQTDRWLLSTDVGNLFMLLDGLTHAWQLDQSAELKAVIDGGIAQFLRMDLVAVQAQTHATLTVLRALLRLYRLTREDQLLRAVEERYRVYRQLAMTENYANYNWFDRPDTWTEPCAVIDSFIVAVELWQLTDDPAYLEDAHLIWFNAVERGQRATGGFGTDSCAGYNTPILKMALGYEAFFCCTMRGGEGHSAAIQSAYHSRPGELALTFYTDSRADLDLGSGRLTVEQSTGYPYEGRVELRVVSTSISGPITMRLFNPSWMATPQLRLNGNTIPYQTDAGFIVIDPDLHDGDTLVLESSLGKWTRPSHNPHSLDDYRAVHVGPLVLGYEGEARLTLPSPDELVREGDGCYRVNGTDAVLTRINNLSELPWPACDPLDHPDDPACGVVSDESAQARQILFPE
jgi:uncharacterized protein